MIGQMTKHSRDDFSFGSHSDGRLSMAAAFFLNTNVPTGTTRDR
jgi:hypothetical protein